jgi:hypothetical protein
MLPDVNNDEKPRPENESKPNPDYTTPKPGVVVGVWLHRDHNGHGEYGRYVADPSAPHGQRKVVDGSA